MEEQSRLAPLWCTQWNSLQKHRYRRTVCKHKRGRPEAFPALSEDPANACLQPDVEMPLKDVPSFSIMFYKTLLNRIAQYTELMTEKKRQLISSETGGAMRLPQV